MRLSEPGLSEADLAAHFEYMCARGGSQRPAYVPVVASGWVIALLSELIHLLTSFIHLAQTHSLSIIHKTTIFFETVSSS